jgi:hypothetical protein
MAHQLRGLQVQDGFYRIDYEGSADVGAGAFALVRGKIAGLDVGGLTYTGSYSLDGKDVVGTVAAKAPPGATLVTGSTAGPTGASFEVAIRVRENGLLELQSPIGPLRGRMTLISPL